MALELNHVTLSVRELARSLAFYVDLLGLRVEATWDRGAYLTAGATWVCLSLDANVRTGPLPEYTHLAFGCSRDELATFRARLSAAAVPTWQENRSEGESIYFLDPDGHKLELHVGDLRTRLESCRERPYDGMVFRKSQ